MDLPAATHAIVRQALESIDSVDDAVARQIADGYRERREAAQGEFGIGKPDERVYRAALAALGQEPRDAWMAGDNLEWEIAAPQRLGIHAIWVNVRGSGVPAESRVRPDRIIRSLSELI